MTTTSIRQVREDIICAIGAEEPLSNEQVRELFTFEAAGIGLTYDEALERARNGSLPKDEIRFGLDFLARSLSQ